MTNAGNATVGAIASATNVAGLADASASVSGGVIQDATSTEAELNFDNSGSFTVSAIANADGDSADADATVDVGIGQYANASAVGTGTALVPSGDATVSLTNSSTGSISILADANAFADLGSADASAHVDSGVSQYRCGAFATRT